jgi:polar amino acid transport system substrate-binding protein/arginine/ornithine transport system substrate-binding protein
MTGQLTRRALGAATIGIATAGAARAQNRPRLRFAVEGANPPWNFVTPQGQVAGIDVEIANEICRRLDVTCEVSAQNWDGIIPGLLANRFDAIIAGMAMTPARRERVAFTDQYRRIISTFIARRGQFTDITPAALRGKRIGVQRGASQHIWLQRAGYEGVATIVLYDTVGGPEMDLIAGRVDLIVMNKITAHLGLMQRPEARGLEFVGPELFGGDLGDGAGIALRKEDTELQARLNRVLAEMNQDGTLKRIYERQIPFPML